MVIPCHSRLRGACGAGAARASCRKRCKGTQAHFVVRSDRVREQSPERQSEDHARVMQPKGAENSGEARGRCLVIQPLPPVSRVPVA